MTMDTEQQVKRERKQERTAVSLEVVFEGSSGRRQARISDLSLGGCFVDSIVHISVGEKILLKIRDLEGEWHEVAGEIVYIFAGCGFGVRFAPLTEKQKIVFEHLILMQGGNPWGEG